MHVPKEGRSHTANVRLAIVRGSARWRFRTECERTRNECYGVGPFVPSNNSAISTLSS